MQTCTVEGRTSTKHLRVRDVRERNNDKTISKETVPESYCSNSKKEKMCLANILDFTDRFLKENEHFRDRLYIVSENEFGVSKCVCSTIKPELLPYPKLHSVDECSRFFSLYLDFEPLENSSKPPRTLPSPSQVLKWGVGDAFDMSVLLVSFLIGSGHDAYVVYGTAPRWICTRDRRRIPLENVKKGQGNTIMIGGSVMVGAGITNKSPVTMKDVVPLARLTEEAGVLVVPTSGKIQNWKDFAAAIKANPKAVSVAGGSAGGTDHLLLGLIVKALGADARNAAYVAFQGGGPANAAILGGQVSAGISGYSEFEEQIKAGKMKAIAVSGNKRIPGVDVPTLKELGLNVTAANWRGVFGAPGISNDQKAKLVDFLTKLHASEAWKKTLTERKWTDVFLSGEAFQKEIDKDIKETGLILKDLGLA